MPQPFPPDRNAAAGRAPEPLGPMLRDWRARRRLSQMDLALEVGVSPRHLSFVETGRSRPSPAVLIALADHLDVPLRERNRWLLAAGHAPRYTECGLDAEGMASVKAALQRLLDAHDPYPGLVLDRQWNVVLANRAASALAALVPEALRSPTLNVFRASLHPDALAAHTANFDGWAVCLLASLQRAVATTGDPALAALEREVLAYPNLQAIITRGAVPAAAQPPMLLVNCVLDLPVGRVSLFTTLTTFGTPRDITLEELCIELFYPADDASAALLRRAA